jgi:electron transfer flavoprotein alpha subunit
MDQSKIIIAINNDPQAPIHKIADYSIIGDLNEVVPKMIASYKKQSK